MAMRLSSARDSWQDGGMSSAIAARGLACGNEAFFSVRSKQTVASKISPYLCWAHGQEPTSFCIALGGGRRPRAGAPGHANRASLGAIWEPRPKSKLGRFGFDFRADFGSILRAQNEPANSSFVLDYYTERILRPQFWGREMGPKLGSESGPEAAPWASFWAPWWDPSWPDRRAFGGHPENAIQAVDLRCYC